MYPYRWHIILTLGFLLTTTLVFFAVAAKSEPKIQITVPEVEPITEPSISFIDPTLGPSEAAVTIVEFADFTCDACALQAERLTQLIKKYPDDVRLVWKDFPNESLHPEATKAAIAARCADAQGMFWAYHDELFRRQNQIGQATYLSIANDLGLDQQVFAECLSSNEPLPRIRKTYEEGLALSLTATPTLFVNGERFTGAVSLQDLEALVKSLINQ